MSALRTAVSMLGMYDDRTKDAGQLKEIGLSLIAKVPVMACSLSSNIFISLRINSILEAKIRNFSHISCNPPLFCIFAVSN